MASVTCPKCEHVNVNATSSLLDTCPACGLIYSRYDATAALRDRIMKARSTGDWRGIPRAQIPAEVRAQAAASMPVTTTPSVPGRPVVGVIDVISAECAYGMNMFKDFFVGITDTLGGRSSSTQNTLRDARRAVMTQLRAEAFAIGADAVIGVNLDYSEFSGGGKSMLFVVATGTAVTLAPTAGAHN